MPDAGTIANAFRSAMSTPSGIKPASMSATAGALFPSLQSEDALVAVERLLGHLNTVQDPDPRFRAHYFFRTIQGLWACSDPNCSAVDADYQSEHRRVGRVYPAPRFTCECGSRVLELLYCESCGETMLGGFVARSHQREFLLSTSSDLESVPDRTTSTRNAHTYRVYWPTARQPVGRASWSRTGRKSPTDQSAPAYTMTFRKAKYLPGDGRDTQAARRCHRLRLRDQVQQPT